MPEPLPYPDVRPDEQIIRYLLQPKWFNQRTGHISGQAFIPRNPKTQGMPFATSVYRTDGCLLEEIWSIGDEFVTNRHRDKLPVLGIAGLQAQKVFAEDLQVEPSPDDHARHADIVRWPEEREERLAKAHQLAVEAQLVVRPIS